MSQEMGSNASKASSKTTSDTNNSGVQDPPPGGSTSSSSAKQTSPQQQSVTVAKDAKDGSTSKTKENNDNTEETSDSKQTVQGSSPTETKLTVTGGAAMASLKGDKSDTDEKIKGGNPSDGKETEDERIIIEGSGDQKGFDSVTKLACSVLKPESLFTKITQNVTKLQLQRALPSHIQLTNLLNKFTTLKELDLSKNDIGPQAFRAVCLAMCRNPTILSLNLAGNRSDTDSAECLGKMLTENSVLQYLDVSSNYLGKDFFSRNVGPALKVNTTLQTLRCCSIGSTDIKVFLEGLKENTSLIELDISNNDISDRTVLGKVLAECLKKPECSLNTLCLSRCGINASGTQALLGALSDNKSLRQLNLAGNEFSSLTTLLQFVLTAVRQSLIVNLCLDGSTVKDNSLTPETLSCEQVSALQILSLNNCCLTDTFFEHLVRSCQGKLLSLTDLDVGVNEGLTPGCVVHIVSLTSDSDHPSCVRRLMYGLNVTENLPKQLAQDGLPCLQYLNIRMCRISPASVGSLGSLLGQGSLTNLSTLILDNLKLSGTKALSELLATSTSLPVTTLSLGGCALDDNDLSPLVSSLKNGFKLHMLKLSANRLTDEGVASIVEAVLKNKTHPLSVLDLSNNRVGDAGSKTLSKLYTTKSHQTSLHSVNLSYNNIGKEGLLSIVSVMGGKSALRTLYLQHQGQGLDEGEIVEVYDKLAAALGCKIVKDGEHIKAGCADVPKNFPDTLTVDMTNLGGQTGEIGAALDSCSIRTDRPLDRLPTLSIADVMQICSYLKGMDTGECVWSEQEWNMITGADRATTDTPSWLKLSSKRELCVYLSNLPGNTTQQKVEALLEMEADCNLDEACLMKDPVTRSVNGIGWVVLCDTESVSKALDYFTSGQAKIFGQTFMISKLNVKVDDEASTGAERNAQEDQLVRQKQRRSDDAAHRTLIQKSTEESWKRHAYRLAHPAYADGRIW